MNIHLALLYFFCFAATLVFGSKSDKSSTDVMHDPVSANENATTIERRRGQPAAGSNTDFDPSKCNSDLLKDVDYGGILQVAYRGVLVIVPDQDKKWRFPGDRIVYKEPPKFMTKEEAQFYYKLSDGFTRKALTHDEFKSLTKDIDRLLEKNPKYDPQSPLKYDSKDIIDRYGERLRFHKWGGPVLQVVDSQGTVMDLKEIIELAKQDIPPMSTPIGGKYLVYNNDAFKCGTDSRPIFYVRKDAPAGEGVMYFKQGAIREYVPAEEIAEAIAKINSTKNVTTSSSNDLGNDSSRATGSGFSSLKGSRSPNTSVSSSPKYPLPPRTSRSRSSSTSFKNVSSFVDHRRTSGTGSITDKGAQKIALELKNSSVTGQEKSDEKEQVEKEEVEEEEVEEEEVEEEEIEEEEYDSSADLMATLVLLVIAVLVTF